MNRKFINYLMVFGASVLIISACKTTEPEVKETEQTVTSDLESNEPSAEKELIVTINEMVEYNFSKTDGDWQGSVTQFDSNDPELQKVVRVFSIQPVLGWEDFENMVEFLNIYEMPDQAEIVNRKPGPITPQSRAYRFTIIDGDESRSYSYFNPEEESQNHWQSQQIVTFGSYLVLEMKAVETTPEQ